MAAYKYKCTWLSIKELKAVKGKDMRTWINPHAFDDFLPKKIEEEEFDAFKWNREHCRYDALYGHREILYGYKNLAKYVRDESGGWSVLVDKEFKYKGDHKVLCRGCNTVHTLTYDDLYYRRFCKSCNIYGKTRNVYEKQLKRLRHLDKDNTKFLLPSSLYRLRKVQCKRCYSIIKWEDISRTSFSCKKCKEINRYLDALDKVIPARKQFDNMFVRGEFRGYNRRLNKICATKVIAESRRYSPWDYSLEVSEKSWRYDWYIPHKSKTGRMFVTSKRMASRYAATRYARRLEPNNKSFSHKKSRATTFIVGWYSRYMRYDFPVIHGHVPEFVTDGVYYDLITYDDVDDYDFKNYLMDVYNNNDTNYLYVLYYINKKGKLSRVNGIDYSILK